MDYEQIQIYGSQELFEQFCMKRKQKSEDKDLRN